jgi:pimeloyl-ACP methyl ester carboxylesterase
MNHPAPASPLGVPTRLGPLRVETIGSGPPAVLWHSLFVDSTTWHRLRAPLATHRRLVLIDGPNHGGNPPTRRRFTLDECVGVAVDVLDQLGIGEQVDWLGNAWGGHVGILFAAAHPDRCRSLMAIGAPIHALGPSDRRRIRFLAEMVRLVGPRPVVNPLVDALLGTSARASDPESAAIVADAFRRADRRAMSDAIRWLSLRRRDLSPELDSLEVPTLLTTGPHDPMYTIADARAAAVRLRTGTLAILPGAGHIGPLLRAAPAVAELVTTFWRSPQAIVAEHRRAADSAISG